MNPPVRLLVGWLVCQMVCCRDTVIRRDNPSENSIKITWSHCAAGVWIILPIFGLLVVSYKFFCNKKSYEPNPLQKSLLFSENFQYFSTGLAMMVRKLASQKVLIVHHV